MQMVGVVRVREVPVGVVRVEARVPVGASIREPTSERESSVERLGIGLSVGVSARLSLSFRLSLCVTPVPGTREAAKEGVEPTEPAIPSETEVGVEPEPVEWVVRVRLSDRVRGLDGLLDLGAVGRGNDGCVLGDLDGGRGVGGGSRAEEVVALAVVEVEGVGFGACGSFRGGG